jgi:tRNA/rRNA methyltransferase
MAEIQPAFILVQPQMGENIGAAARAICNFGLNDLHLVKPRDGWPSKIAEANASGALDIINPPQVFDTVEESLQPYHTVYATTARPRDMRKKVFTPAQAAKDIQQKHNAGEKTAILFGGERAGLSNDDIALAHHIISVPVNPDFSSINLAQSVLLMAYELFQANDNTPAEILPTGDSQPVTHRDFNDLMTRLEKELDIHHFFRSEGLRPTMVRNIRNIFARADMTEQEARTLQGIISALTGQKKK